MQIDQKFFKNYRELILGAVLILIAAIFGLKFIIHNISLVSERLSENKVQKNKLKDVQNQIKAIEKAKEQMLNKQSKIKQIYDPKSAPEDSIASFGNMFDDIIDSVKTSGLKLRSVEYKINPSEDQIYSKFPTLYNVCKVKVFIVGTYTQLESLLRDLSVYPYFINISEIKISPYENDKQYLIINLAVTLYSKKQQGVGSLM